MSIRYWQRKADIARWRRSGLMTRKQAREALKELEKTKDVKKVKYGT